MSDDIKENDELRGKAVLEVLHAFTDGLQAIWHEEWYITGTDARLFMLNCAAHMAAYTASYMAAGVGVDPQELYDDLVQDLVLNEAVRDTFLRRYTEANLFGKGTA